MAKFAVLIEFDLTEDGPSFEEAVRPMMDALRNLAPVEPSNVTAFAYEAAQRVIDAAHAPDEPREPDRR